jgi:HlyD family secretion protein
MTANVSIIIAHRENVLRIPNAALRYRPPEATNTTTQASTGRSGGNWRAGGGSGGRPRGERRAQRTVYVLKDGNPQSVEVKAGITDGVFTEVTEGLNENDKIITAAVVKKEAAARPTNPFGGGMRFR